MSQSNLIFFFLFAAFFVFITVRGELPTYMGLLLLPPKQAPSQDNTTGFGAVGTSSTVFNIAGNVAAATATGGLY